MCMQCVGAVGTGLQAATIFGGPILLKWYRRTRAALGLPDDSVAAVEAREAAEQALVEPATSPDERETVGAHAERAALGAGVPFGVWSASRPRRSRPARPGSRSSIAPRSTWSAAAFRRRGASVLGSVDEA
jgi:hypothetical protein